MPRHLPTDGPLPRAALIKIPRQPRSVEMVQCILNAGMHVIEEEGLHAMTTNRVAERAGVSVGSLYQYFANRDSILAGIIERSMLDIMQLLQMSQAAGLDQPVENLLRGGLILMLRYYDPYLPVVRRVLREAPLLADNGMLSSMEQLLVDLIRDYLLHNSHRYRLRHGTASVQLAASALILMYLRWLAEPFQRVSEAQFVDALVQQVMAMIEVIE
ncbi:MAG: TetR/AcrR family transcriptional regulator [Alcanivoracaceae bacterium]|jgi:AcrR family transcriptional regulator|nr:TetR/AcrR family transcriptional regulator [Alcanivoracaceae bacterium]